jgi:hypothetical protein
MNVITGEDRLFMNPIVHCSDAQPAIDAYLASGARVSAAVAEHLQQCDLCQHRYSDAALTRLLQRYEIEPPRPGFIDAAVYRATLQQDDVQPRAVRMRKWAGAMAASVAAIAVAFGALLVTTVPALRPSDADFHIALMPEQSKTIRVLIDSVDDRDHATITISLAENLELDGFPNEHVIEWETNLKAGKNLLALPLRLKNAGDAYVDVAFTYGETRKQVRIDVSALPPVAISPVPRVS